MAKEVVRKGYLEELRLFKDKKDIVKVITGVRRCGKSTVMRQFIEELRGAGEDGIVSVDFEDFSFDFIKGHEDLNRYLKDNIDPQKRTYVFLDEIQRVEGWERSVNGLLASLDVDVYISGSNAHVLSSELSTFLTGRYVQIKMLPLSFSEYCEMHSDKSGDPHELFALYTRYGAFPHIDPFADDRATRALLSDLYSAIVYNDILSREEVRGQPGLERLTRFLMINIGNPVSANSIAKSMGGMAYETVDRYLRLLEGAHLFYRADRFDLKSSALAPTPKYYSVDTGLRNAPMGYVREDLGRLLENIVYLELLRRGYGVRVGRYGDKEIDFAAVNRRGEPEYFQVALSTLSEGVAAREHLPLRALNNSFPKTVISMDERLPSVTRDGIRHVHIVDWLLMGG
ncbi:MAG: ATP-binding protein [Methanomassiliicoccaceae archaeon]|nr:ATP-binding protein [Methanomassiliicoccaceae archaeon]